MISIKTIIDKKAVSEAIKKVARRSPEIIKKTFIGTSLVIQRYLREDRMTGGTSSTRLGVRSGRLRSSVRPISFKQKGSAVYNAGVSIGTAYAKSHIGKRGSFQIIRRKNKRYLAIPLTNTPAGPTTKFFQKTFVAKSKKGNLIVFGQKTITRGIKAGQAKGQIVPLFVLKKKVKIKRRIAVEDVISRMRKEVIFELRKEERKWANP